MATEKQKRKILIGVAWPYANGYQHLGHLAGAYLPPDPCPVRQSPPTRLGPARRRVTAPLHSAEDSP